MLGEKSHREAAAGLETRSKRNTRANSVKPSPAEISPGFSDANQAQKENQATPSTNAFLPTPQQSATNTGSMIKRKFRDGPEDFPGTKCLKTKEKSNSNSSNAFNPLNNLPQMSDALPQDFKAGAKNNHPTRKTRAAKSRKPQVPQASVNLPTTPPADWSNFKSDETLDPKLFNPPTNTEFSNASPSIFGRVGSLSNDTSGCQTPTQKGAFSGTPADLLDCTFIRHLPPTLPVNSRRALELRAKLLEEDIPHFNALYEVWIDNIARESKLRDATQFNYTKSPTALQEDITLMDRWKVLDWLRDIVCDHKLTRQTFHAAIQFVDICLSNFEFLQESFQIIAVAALLVAIKTHDAVLFNTESLLEFIWDDEERTEAENQRDLNRAHLFLLKYEYKICRYLNWDVFLPTPLDFLKHAFHFAAIYEGEPEPLEDIPFQLYDTREREARSSTSVLHPKFDIMLFIRAATILDNAVLDFESTSFTGSELASGIFWIVYPHEQGRQAQREKLLTIATGYNIAQLGRVLEFLQDYRSSCRSQDVLEVLGSEKVQEVAVRFEPTEDHFRIEEDQTPSLLKEHDYDEILRVRAQKYGLFFQSFLNLY